MRRSRLDSRTAVGRVPFVLATLALLGLVTLPAAPCRGAEIGKEIDSQVWEVISATVAANDIEGMAAAYHPDAVLVSPRGTVAIARQLVKWGEGMKRIELEGRSASVSFRFTSRQDDGETAFEGGMFRYAETDEQGVETPHFIPFEALLVKKNGRWLLVMERQLEATDESAWSALGSPGVARDRAEAHRAAEAGSDESELLAIHQAVIQAHLDGAVDVWLDLESEDYASANRGEITSPTREERRARRKPYLESTTFTRYRDLREPLVQVSADGTQGWLLAQVEIAGVRSMPDGTEAPFEAVYAWVELYRKEAGAWKLVGNVSNARAGSGS